MLSKKQYSALGACANRAFRYGVSAEEKQEIAFILRQQGGRDSSSAVFDTWRRQELARIFAEPFERARLEPPRSFAELRQKDYAPAMEHFAALAGDDAAAIEYRHRARVHGRAVVMSLIESSCRSRALQFPQYPDSICRDQYGCQMIVASEKQLWTILFTVRNRRHCSPRDEQPPDTRANHIPQAKFLN